MSQLEESFSTADLNKQLQDDLREYLRLIDSALQRNQQLQRRFRALVSSSQRLPPKKTITQPLLGSVYWKHNGECPEDNVDTLAKKSQRERMPSRFKTRKWSKAEDEALMKGVRAKYQEAHLQQYVAKYSETHGGSAPLLADLNNAMDEISAKSLTDLLPIECEIDWSKFAETYVSSRTAADCKIRWENVNKPTLNHSDFSKAEDKMLLKIITENPTITWAAAAEQLGTHRTAIECFKRYQRSLNPNLLKSKWSEEEDNKLKQAVGVYGEKNWTQVAGALDGRNGSQCMHRWLKVLRPGINKGRWTIEEDKILTLAVKAYGVGKWSRIAVHLPQRTDVQCRERWCNILDPNVDVSNWTPQEDASLVDLVERMGPGRWSAIAQEMNRTDNQVWRRWKILEDAKVPEYYENLTKRRKALVQNFQGRKRHRPELTPDDFELASRVGSTPGSTSVGDGNGSTSMESEPVPDIMQPDQPRLESSENRSTSKRPRLGNGKQGHRGRGRARGR